MDYLYYPNNTKAAPSPQPLVNKVNGSIYNKHISSSTTTTTTAAQCCYHSSSSSSNAYQGNSRLKYKIAKDDDVLMSSMKSTSQSPHKRNKSALTYINATNDSCSSINKRKSNVSFIKTSKLNFDRIKNASFYNNSTNSNSNNNNQQQQQQQQPLSSKRESCSKRYFNSTNINNSNWNYTERVHYNNNNAVNNHNECGVKYNKIKHTVNVNVNKSLHYGVRKNCLSKGREKPLPKHNVNDNSCSCSNSSSSMIINHKYNYKQYIYENEQHKNNNDDDVVNGLDSVNKQHKSDVNDKDTNSSTSNSSGHRTVIGYTRNTTRNGMNGSNSHINMNNSLISSCNNYSQCIKQQQQQQQQHIHHCKEGSISTTTCETSKIHVHNNNNNTHNKQSSQDMITFTTKIDSIEDAHINFVKMIQDTKKLCIQKEQSLIVVDTDDIYID